MKVPRDISGADLTSYLLSIGFRKVRQTGSHVRLEFDRNGKLMVSPCLYMIRFKTGTLKNIVKDGADKTGRDWIAIMEKF